MLSPAGPHQFKEFVAIARGQSAKKDFFAYCDRLRQAASLARVSTP
jgi:hypothetical protein